MPSFADAENRLLAERDRLKAEIADVAARPAEYAGVEESYYGNHLADTATDIFEEEKALALEAHLIGMLAKVEAALERIANGTYGICEKCGKPIAPERLAVLPYATTCVTCSAGSQRPQTASRG